MRTSAKCPKLCIVLVIAALSYVFSVNNVFAQTGEAVQIKGKVNSSEDGEPLPGVNVVEKGTTNGTITNVEGKYNLTVPGDATIVFSSVGYASRGVYDKMQLRVNVQ